jgi:hypothetical protein
LDGYKLLQKWELKKIVKKMNERFDLKRKQRVVFNSPIPSTGASFVFPLVNVILKVSIFHFRTARYLGEFETKLKKN